MEIVRHAFLEKYPIRASDEILILGTLHPGDVGSFIIPFFYGNRNSLWRLLSKAFPYKLKNPDNLENVIRFLHHYNIAVSDVIREGRRKHSRSGDSDLIHLQYNHELVDQIRNSNIKRVICTSGNHSKGSFGIFTRKILNYPIDESRQRLIQGIDVHTVPLGKTIRIYALPSPSGAANPGIATSAEFKEWKESTKNKNKSVVDYRIALYREILAAQVL